MSVKRKLKEGNRYAIKVMGPSEILKVPKAKIVNKSVSIGHKSYYGTWLFMGMIVHAKYENKYWTVGDCIIHADCVKEVYVPKQ